MGRPPKRTATKRTIKGTATLAQLVTTAPRLAAPREAKAKVVEWLAKIGRTEAGKRLAQVFQTSLKTESLITALADGSPYLWDLAHRDAARLATILETDPDKHLKALLQKTTHTVARTRDEAKAMAALRRMKAEAALLIGLADLGGIWPVMRVTQAMTAFADTAVNVAVRFLVAEAGRRGLIKLSNNDVGDISSGLIVLAMGKMGAGELNYSSDIDLIVFYEPSPALAPETEPGAFYVRLTRGLVKLLQERTGEGYVFRVDLRLRPDPASTQIAVSTAAALDYYGSIGQNWERAALIKARPCAGDRAVGDAFLRELSPFIWRKYLDYAAVADIETMKRQIHAYQGHDEIAVEGHNIKVGRGGIREVEFFVQTQQLIAGGRHPELRGRETLGVLQALAAGGWIGHDAMQQLDAAYRFLREIEHRLQMVNDDQTHTLPADRAGLELFSRFAGFKGREDFAQTLTEHLRNVQRHYAALFEETPERSSTRALIFPPDADDHETLDCLGALGFRSPLEVSFRVRQWLQGSSYPSLKGEFARSQFAALVPLLLDRLARSENPDLALTAFDGFLAGLHGGGRLFSLLRQHSDFVTLVALILGTAPRLADILSRYPQAMDALLDPAFFGALPDEGELATALDRSLTQARSYEDVLDRLRLFGQEQMFLIGARVLSGTVNAEQAGAAFARLADVVILALHRVVEDGFAQQHGRIRGQATALLALGKLGGREMTATSDLDLIIVYDFDEEHPQSKGARSLYGAQYFARLTHRLISALTAPTNYGALYQVDMRLRPSGRAGPVATGLVSFESYQENEAWTWEHMALTRARVVSAPPGFATRIEAVIYAVLSRQRNATAIARDVVEMRRAIAQEKGEDNRWDLKYAAGGLIDLEFTAQYLQLVHAAKHPDILDTSTAQVFDKAWRLGLLPAEATDVLRPATRLYHNLTQILRLCLTGPFDRKTAGAGLLGLLARAADLPDFATLDAHLTETQQKVRASFNHILGVAA